MGEWTWIEDHKLLHEYTIEHNHLYHLVFFTLSFLSLFSNQVCWRRPRHARSGHSGVAQGLVSCGPAHQAEPLDHGALLQR